MKNRRKEKTSGSISRRIRRAGYLTALTCALTALYTLVPPIREGMKQAKERPEYNEILGLANVCVDSLEGVERLIPEAPVYPESEVPANYCARYVRFAARDLFGKNYPAADAWDIRDFESVGKIILKDNVLRELACAGTLKPGMVLGMYNPQSRYNNHPEAKKAGYTHVLLYLGDDENRRLYFADKFGRETRRITLSELQEKYGLIPKEILYVSD